jgi:adenylate cyclase
LSSDPEQEFFSDGLTEEIGSALAKIPDLSVVARTSAFGFKDQNRDIRTIGEQLGATHLIEGSVRKAADRVRITVQLIEAGSGTRLWSENYDRELTDILAIQEEIATAVASSLRVPLGLEPGETLVSRSIDPRSYELFLQGRGLWTARGPANFADAQAIFEQITASNPSYAPAWAYLCATHYVVATGIVDEDPLTEQQRRTVRDRLQKADAACRQAVASDPGSATSYAAAATLAWSTGRPLEGEELYLKALALDPDDANALHAYGSRLAAAGRLKQALPLLLKAHAVEPFAPSPARYAVSILWLTGMDEEATTQAKALRPADRANTLARLYASTGRFSEAADALMDGPDADSAMIRETVRLLRDGPAQTLPSQSALQFDDTGGDIGARAIDFLYLSSDVPGEVLSRVLDNLESRADAGFVGGEVNYIWHPAYAPLRRTERFKSFMRKAGYVDYWRAKGWPELCRPVGANDFTCD